MQEDDEIYEAIKRLDTPGRASVRDRIEQNFRHGVTKTNIWHGVHCGALAGLFLKLACALSAASKKEGSTSVYNAPAWKELAEKVNDEIGRLEVLIPDFFDKVDVSWQSIAQFATMATVADGSRKKIYHKLVFFASSALVGEILSESYMVRSLTSDELKSIELSYHALLSEIRGAASNSNSVQAVDALSVENGTTGAQRETRLSTSPPNSDASTVSVHFKLKPERLADLASFCDRFSFGEDGNVHAAVYRPRQSNPNILMKSFLAIKSPAKVGEIEKASYEFTHIYKPDLVTKNDRIASGKVIPLEEAVYLIGGQGPLIKSSGNEKVSLPFRSSKVIVARWEDIVQHHALFGGLTISMSGSGRVIASRVAIRVTPIDHSDKIKLREVACDKLLADLVTDIEVEKRIVDEVLSDPLGQKGGQFRRNANHFLESSTPEELAEFARSILRFSNNSPGRDFRVNLAEKFEGENKSVLRSSALADRIDVMLREKPGPYRNDIGEELDIWTHLRFGPLQIG